MTARDRRARVGPKVATENARTCDTSSSSCPRFLRGDGPDFRLPGGATAEALSNLASIAPGKGQHLGPVCRLSHREHARNVGPKRKPFPLSNLKAHRQLLSGRRPVCNACTTIGLIEIFDEVVDSLSHLHPDGQPGCRTAHPQPGRDQDEARACLERGLSNALQETKKKKSPKLVSWALQPRDHRWCRRVQRDNTMRRIIEAKKRHGEAKQQGRRNSELVSSQCRK